MKVLISGNLEMLQILSLQKLNEVFLKTSEMHNQYQNNFF